MAQEFNPPFHVNLSECAALVTGAGEGIGRAIALALAASGAAVVANDLNPDRADRVAEEIQAAGGRSIPWQADVSNRFQVGSMIEAGRDAFGKLNILVNAASVEKLGSMSALDEWDWRRILDVNITGAFFCTQLLSRVMADEGGGVIVNVGSTAGHGITLPDGDRLRQQQGGADWSDAAERARACAARHPRECGLSRQRRDAGIARAGEAGIAGGSGERGPVPVFGGGELRHRAGDQRRRRRGDGINRPVPVPE